MFLWRWLLSGLCAVVVSSVTLAALAGLTQREEASDAKKAAPEAAFVSSKRASITRRAAVMDYEHQLSRTTEHIQTLSRRR